MFCMIVSAVIAASGLAGLLCAAVVRRKVPGQRLTVQTVFCSLAAAGGTAMFLWFYQLYTLLLD